MGLPGGVALQGTRQVLLGREVFAQVQITETTPGERGEVIGVEFKDLRVHLYGLGQTPTRRSQVLCVIRVVSDGIASSVLLVPLFPLLARLPARLLGSALRHEGRVAHHAALYRAPLGHHHGELIPEGAEQVRAVINELWTPLGEWARVLVVPHRPLYVCSLASR